VKHTVPPRLEVASAMLKIITKFRNVHSMATGRPLITGALMNTLLTQLKLVLENRISGRPLDFQISASHLLKNPAS
jgi:hypothetical protein